MQCVENALPLSARPYVHLENGETDVGDEVTDASNGTRFDLRRGKAPSRTGTKLDASEDALLPENPPRSARVPTTRS